ncbi:helix-turn-helix transcriptional regulator [Clostridium massiliodielmoense]|uniref:helix-turn-helix transcriptional regulator n=1 Tax=Clostridium massiliodielmoense TaxID=1776385 RepID=UPI0004D9888D|nr:helix-turn-helix transcriptional regulator [Clostridium massiliodielmoense]KEH96119.1 transcriptional regulator [Clostridium botulinum C/D str. BKT12695]
MNVKLRRIELGIKQQDFAKQLGIGRSTLLKIEKGNYDNVKIGLAKKISEILEVPVQELFFNE